MTPEVRSNKTYQTIERLVAKIAGLILPHPVAAVVTGGPQRYQASRRWINLTAALGADFSLSFDASGIYKSYPEYVSLLTRLAKSLYGESIGVEAVIRSSAKNVTPLFEYPLALYQSSSPYSYVASVYFASPVIGPDYREETDLEINRPLPATVRLILKGQGVFADQSICVVQHNIELQLAGETIARAALNRSQEKLVLTVLEEERKMTDNPETVPVSVEIGSITLEYRELMALRPGAEISFEAVSKIPAVLNVAGTPWASVNLSVQDQGIVAEITDLKELAGPAATENPLERKLSALNAE
ncbi:MAG: FliM/FliN family flagellar motor switch protein [Candidatus Dadabacteria bacterium]|nr:MAG: FliM/FliN family flagellar motor switch protein [Candidatus Dadabacteria bacterium]